METLQKKQHQYTKNCCIIRCSNFLQDPRVSKEAFALKEAGYRVHVISTGERGQKYFEQYKSIHIHRIPLVHSRIRFFSYISEYFIFFIYALFTVTFLHLRYAFDFVQVNTMPDFLVFATIFVKLSGKKVVLDMHEAMPELFMHKFNKPRRNLMVRILEVIEKKSMQFADLVIYVNKVIFKYYSDRGLKESKALLVPNVPDESIFKKAILSQSQPTTPILVTHGTLEKRYGVQTVIKSIDIVKKTYSDVKLYIIGKGEHSDKLKSLAKELNLYDKNVIFTGYIDIREITEYLNKANLGIVPLEKNIYTNIMTPNKLFEYVTLGIPVISSDLEGIKDFFDETEIAFFVPGDPESLANKILEKIRQWEKAVEMAKKANERSQNFSWGKVKIDYIQRIEAILSC